MFCELSMYALHSDFRPESCQPILISCLASRMTPKPATRSRRQRVKSDPDISTPTLMDVLNRFLKNKGSRDLWKLIRCNAEWFHVWVFHPPSPWALKII